MGFRKGKTEPEVIVASGAPQSLIGSAVRLGLSDAAWRGYRFTDEAWQKQAWDFYDTNGQLHNSVEYVGSACSMIRIFVAEVDENGVRQGEVEDDPEIAALADSLFGSPANKAEMLRGIGESLTVAGEVFILGKSARNDLGDQWWTAAPSEVRRNGNIVYVNMGRAQREELNPGRDLIIRCWTPHPRRHYLADSPVRASLGLLSEMEQMQLFLRAQLTSRIANATILPVPSTLSVPRGDDQSVSNDDIYEQIFEVITSNLEGRGTAAQVAPILWQMPLEELKAMSGIGPIRFDSPLSDQAIALRAEQQNKLAIAMNVPVEIQVGGQEMSHWCASMDTSILTRDHGWLTQDKLEIGMIVLTINADTGVSEWQPVMDIARFDVENLEMVKVQNRDHSSLTTKSHRWIVDHRQRGREWVTADQIEHNHHIITAAPHAHFPSGKYEDAFVELVGWFITEGTLSRSQIRIGQSWKANPAMVARLRRVITDVFGEHGNWHEATEDRGMTIFTLNKGCFEPLVEVMQDAKAKVISRDFIFDLTESQLHLLIEAAGLGDGIVRRNGGVTIGQRDQRRLEPLELAGILAGRRVVSRVGMSGGFTEKREQHSLTVGEVGRQTTRIRNSHSTELYTGVVWCPVTANGTWFARRDGTAYFTGNSIWWAGEEFITKTVMPLFNRIVDALNSAYLMPALKKLGRDASRFTYWYDTAPLANSANKLTDTLNLFERGIVSADAVLRAGNYNKGDKPTRMEEATRFIKEVILRDPTLFSMDSVREAINIFIDTTIAPEELTTPPPPPPAPGRAITAPEPGQKPIQPAATDAVTEAGDLIASLSARSSVHIAANGAVLRALEVANKRMLNRTTRNMFVDTHATKLHTKFRVSDDNNLDTILASVWDNLDSYMENTGVAAVRIQPVLSSYVKGLMVKSIEHSPSLLSAMLHEAGIR